MQFLSPVTHDTTARYFVLGLMTPIDAGIKTLVAVCHLNLLGNEAFRGDIFKMTYYKCIFLFLLIYFTF